MTNREMLVKIIELQEKMMEVLEALRQEMGARNHRFNQLLRSADKINKRFDKAGK